VSETAVRAAISDGAQSVAALGEVTKAGTGCGSCKSELANLISIHARKTSPPQLAAVS
jgi:NAD(P)H-nitrite reductase large subunit